LNPAQPFASGQSSVLAQPFTSTQPSASAQLFTSTQPATAAQAPASIQNDATALKRTDNVAPYKNPDDLGAFIAALPHPAPSSTWGPPPPRTKVSVEAPTPGRRERKDQALKSSSQSVQGKYFLQAGAYHGLGEAEALKARIMLLGLPVAVYRAEVNGKFFNRVRVGPFSQVAEMNRARSRLGESKIQVAVVRQ
jgi:cell division protein FtsN